MKDNIVAVETYKGYKFFVRLLHNYSTYCCGYIVLDRNLVKELEIDLFSNGTFNESGEITYFYKEGDDWGFDLNDNETIIGFDRGNLGDVNPDNVEGTKAICKEWIDYIINNIKEIG